MPSIQLLTGPQNVGDSALITARGDKQGALLVTDLHNHLYEQCYRGNVFSASTQALVTTTVGLATTYTGLVLSNPITSVVNLVVNKCSWMQSVIQSVQPEAFALAIGYNATTNVTHTTPVATKNNLVGGGGSSVALADVSATLPTAPTYHTFAGNTSTATANGSGGVVDLEGSVILKPGAYIAWVTPAQASVAGMWFSFCWEEVPV